MSPTPGFDRALEDAKLRTAEHIRPESLVLRFAARGPSGRRSYVHLNRVPVAGLISVALLGGIFAALLAICMHYQISFSLSFWPYSMVYRRLIRSLPKGTVSSAGIEVAGPEGRRTIALADIAEIRGAIPDQHFGVTIVLKSGEIVFLDVGFLDVPKSNKEDDVKEWNDEAKELFARAWLLEHELRRHLADQRDRTLHYRGVVPARANEAA